MTCKIMIVDDSSPMRAVVKKTIKAAGYQASQFLEAENGKDALDKLRLQAVDLVVTDYNMPDMDGLELLQRMKEDPVLRLIPVLLVTAFGSQRNQEQFRAAGAAGVVNKPFTPEAIKIEIKRILGEHENEPCLETGNDGLDF